MLRPACCHSFISPNLTFPLHCDPTWNIVFVLALFVLSTNGAVHLLSNVMQLFNLCKSGLIYGAAVRKETRCHWVNAKLHFDKCHQCTVLRLSTVRYFDIFWYRAGKCSFQYKNPRRV